MFSFHLFPKPLSWTNNFRRNHLRCADTHFCSRKEV